MGRRTLLTGAAGLLGGACARRLLDRGDEVIALVRDRDPRATLYRDGLIHRCVEVRAELSDAPRLLAEYAPDAVVHLAAQTQVPVAARAPLSTFESNLRGTWLLLEACRVAPRPPEALVVASTDKVYGAAPAPYAEDGPLLATAPYDVSKLCAELITRSYAESLGLPAVITRCGNLYGPGDLNFERLVPGVCRSLAEGRAPELRSRGGMTREWLYVDDAAAATLLLLDQAPALRGQVFNVGGEERATAAEIAERLRAVAAAEGLSPAPTRYAEADPPGEIPYQALDSGRLRAMGWAPRRRLDDALPETFAWFRGILQRP
ncbi:NAD-dependent epimerase/dehydratase family protein [Myxococcota bacterium]|nr:NAD-dependent epimerase/dehydratase family protein [Myxococcota bacterium]